MRSLKPPKALASPAGRKRSEESRQAILDAALALLGDVGYSALTTDSIAAEARVGKQTIYRWWGTKADVLLEALREGARTIAAPATWSIAGDVDAFFASTFRLARGPRGTGQVLKVLMAQAQLDLAFRERFRLFIETRRAALRAVLARHAHGSASIDAMVDMLFGAFWYRLLLEHAPLDKAFGKTLGRLAAHGLTGAHRKST